MSLTPGFGLDLDVVLPESGSLGDERPADEMLGTPRRPASGKTTDERQQAQWGYLETKDFLAIRAQFEKDNIGTGETGIKTWDIMSNQMKEKGYKRTPKQCKLKWKALVNGFKAAQAAGGDNNPLPEFYEEMDAIFKERAITMDRLLMESDVPTSEVIPTSEVGTVAYEAVDGRETSEIATVAARGENDLGSNEGEPSHLALGTVPAKAKPFKPDGAPSDEDPSGNELEDTHVDAEEPDAAEPDALGEIHLPKKRKYNREDKDARVAQAMVGVLKQFQEQQAKLEESWRETLEGIDLECRQEETDWLERLEALEKQRLEQERIWQVAERERRARDEARSEQRHQLILKLIMEMKPVL